MQPPKRTAYLAGKMTGVKDFNYPEFRRVSRAIAARFDVAVQNPADNFSGYQALNHYQYLSMAIPQVLACDWLILFGDWETSAGACTEAAVALLAGKEIFEYGEVYRPGKDFMIRLTRIKDFDIQLANLETGGSRYAAR